MGHVFLREKYKGKIFNYDSNCYYLKTQMMMQIMLTSMPFWVSKNRQMQKKSGTPIMQKQGNAIRIASISIKKKMTNK